MWALDASALELIFPAAAVCAVLLRMLRIGGKRTVGPFTPFDLLVMLARFVLMALNAAAGYVTARSATMEKMLEGEAILLSAIAQRDLLRQAMPPALHAAPIAWQANRMFVGA